MEYSTGSREDSTSTSGRRSELGWFMAIWLFGGSFAVNCYYSPEVNTSYELAFKYLSIPLSVVSFLTLRYFTKTDQDFQKSSYLIKGFVHLVFAVMWIGMPGNALVLLGNAWFAPANAQPIEGRVVEKWTSRKSKGGISYDIRVFSEQLYRNIWLEVSPSTYSEITIGQRFQTNKIEGAFGILYKRR